MKLRVRSERVIAARGGSVLIAVLWVCLGLVSVTLLFGHSMHMAHRGSDNDLAGRQADQAIEGAARYAEILLTNAPTRGQLPDISTYSREAVPVGEATFWFVGRPETEVTGLLPEFGLIDEAAKINLNSGRARELLLGLPGMTEELAGAVGDWRDDDDNVEDNGAESETYLRLDPPYLCKNADFESIQELALVSGADRIILYGEDGNLNGVLDANEDDGDASLPPDNSDGKLDLGVLEYVTVFSREPNKRSDGTPRIDVSRVSRLPPELTTLLAGTFGPTRAGQIIQSLRSDPGNDRLRGILAFYVRSGMKPEEFEKIADAVATSDDEFTTGLINVNTASEVVLACIPGIRSEKASEVVAKRLTLGKRDTSITWVAEVLGADDAIRASRYLTGRSFQVSADVAALGRHGRGYRRTRFILDNSGETPRIIYRRNLASLGWALGTEVRQTFATKERR